jgi:hypothetical protein
MVKFLGSFVLGVGLLMPTAMVNAQEHHDDQVAKAHQWNESENQYWHQYLKEHHKKDHDWDKATKREQADYWKWRDEHRDAH